MINAAIIVITEKINVFELTANSETINPLLIKIIKSLISELIY